jgi:hypothetical protein
VAIECLAAAQAALFYLWTGFVFRRPAFGRTKKVLGAILKLFTAGSTSAASWKLSFMTGLRAIRAIKTADAI